MLTMSSPLRLLLIGCGLLFAGLFLPLLMMLKFVEASFLLSFLAFTATVFGSIIGMIGAFSVAKPRR